MMNLFTVLAAYAVGVLSVADVYLRNLGESPAAAVIPSIAIFLFLTALVHLAVRLGLQRWPTEKRAVMLAGLMIAYYFLNALNNRFPEYHGSGRVLIEFGWFYFAFFLLAGYGLFKVLANAKNVETVQLFVLIFAVGTYLAYLPGVVGYFNAKIEVENSAATEVFPKLQLTASAKPRDVVILVLDSYPSVEVLKEFYAFDNTPFQRKLEERGFEVISGGVANYPLTELSLAATMNFDYLNEAVSKLPAGTEDRALIYGLTSGNRLMASLKNIGYRIINVSSGWGPTNVIKQADENVNHGPSTEFLLVTFEQNEFLKNTPLYKAWFSSSLSGRSKIIAGFRKLKDLIEQPGAQPRMIFMHSVFPHPPFFFGANGEDVTNMPMRMDGRVWLEKDAYVAQLRYANRVVLEVLESLKNDDEGPIMMIVGDHGTASSEANPAVGWDEPKPELIRERMHPLVAVRYPGSPRGEWREGKKSLVNLVRQIVRKEFKGDLPALADQVFFTSYLTRYRFIEITREAIQ